MNVKKDPAKTTDADVDAAPAVVAESESAPAKRAPRKRAVKAAATEGEAVATPVEPAADAAPEPTADAAAPAAKKTRRRKAATTESSADGTLEPVADATPGATDAPAQAAPEAPVEPVRKPPRKAASERSVAAAASEPGPVAVPVEAAAAPSSSGDEAAVDDGAGDAEAGDAEAGDAESAGSDAAASPDGARSSRRRSRRERRRARQDAGQAAGDADVGDDADEAAGEFVEPPPPVIPANPDELFAQVVSGEFDVDGEPPAEEAAAPPKRVLRPDPDAPKLHKVLAQSGVGSRRDMEQAIADGHVTVNGQTAHVGQRISFGDQIKLNGKPVRVRIVPPPPRILAYHKPVGEVVTHDDPQHRPTVFRRLPKLPQGKWQSVGRLDLNTEGLLLFTNSGELANQLMHPRFGVEREYAVRVLGALDEGDKAELLEGVDVDGQTCSFRSIQNGGGEGANHWYRVVITEGRNREVRKMFEAIDLTVSRLIRIRYGTVVLPRGLKRGVWVDLQDDDVRAIRRLAAPDGEGRDRQEGGRGDGKGRNNKQRGDQRQDRRDGGGGDRGPRQRGGRGGESQRPPAQVQDEARPRDLDRDDDYEEIDHSRIPNPLEQTFDKRFVQNPRSPAGGRGFRSGGGGFGGGGSSNPPQQNKKGGPREPDPLQTSVGYIGADAFHRKGSRNNRGGGQGGGGGGFGRGGGGGGGGGGRRGGR